MLISIVCLHTQTKEHTVLRRSNAGIKMVSITTDTMDEIKKQSKEYLLGGYFRLTDRIAGVYPPQIHTVVSYSPSNHDANSVLVSVAKRYGVTTYLGLPKPQMDAKVSYVADTSCAHMLSAFTSRVLATWNQRFGSSTAFSGVYQTLETAAFSNSTIWSNNLKIYALQNMIVQYRLPKSKERVIISPSASLRAQSLSAVTKSYAQIVQTGKGARIILMPQDGVGTGKVGLSRVREFYAAAKKAGAHEFWANFANCIRETIRD